MQGEQEEREGGEEAGRKTKTIWGKAKSRLRKMSGCAASTDSRPLRVAHGAQSESSLADLGE